MEGERAVLHIANQSAGDNCTSSRHHCKEYTDIDKHSCKKVEQHCGLRLLGLISNCYALICVCAKKSVFFKFVHTYM